MFSDGTPEIIESRENPRYKQWLKLLDKKGREAQQLFLLESVRGLEEGFARGILPQTVLVSEGHEALPDFLRDFPGTVILSERLFVGLSDTQSSQGVIGVYAKPHYDLDVIREATSGRSLLLYLDGIQDPGNLGTIIRSSVAFGVDAILLGPGCVDPYNSKVLRSTLGGVLSLPLIPVDLEDLRQLAAKGYSVVGTSLQGEDIHLPAWKAEKIVLGIGNENKGLGEEYLALCDSLVRIPMSGVESLNAAVATGIALYEYANKGILK